MVKTCVKNSGIYVKLGQAISSMNEVLPRELCNSLRVLQTQALRSEEYDVRKNRSTKTKTKHSIK